MIGAAAAAKGAIALLAVLAAQGTALALVAWLVVRVARLRPAAAAALWLVVMAKLAVPWTPAMPWSLADLVAWLSTSGHASAPVIAGTAVTAAPAAPLAPAIAWLALASAWAIGTMVVLARRIGAHRATLAVARAAEVVDRAHPSGAAALVAELAAKIHVRTPRLALGDAATGPYVIGVLRPIIVIPPALLADPALLRAALLHELAHVRRRDALARCVQTWATAVFFWLPVVRLVGRRLDLSREAACDAWALEASELPRPAYARLLVKMASLRTAAAPGLAHPRTLDARVAAVLGPPVRARVSIAGKLCIAGFAVVALGGARTAAARGQKETCSFTPLLAEELRQAHPEADLDGDGTLSKDEACELQAEMRQRTVTGDPGWGPPDSERTIQLLAEPLCCKCSTANTTTLLPNSSSAETSCSGE